MGSETLKHTWDTTHGSAVLENRDEGGRSGTTYLLWRGERIFIGTEIEHVLATELLSVSAALSAAEEWARRATVKALSDAHTNIHLALSDDTEKDRGHINKWGLSRALSILQTMIAAAERELAGGKEDDSE